MTRRGRPRKIVEKVPEPGLGEDKPKAAASGFTVRDAARLLLNARSGAHGDTVNGVALSRDFAITLERLARQ